MSAAAGPQAPAVPPRPSRSQDKDTAAIPIPKIPPRPAGRRFERSISPEGRFAPSPLNESPLVPRSPKATRHNHSNGNNEHSGGSIERPGSVSMPSVGEEGTEYAAVAEGLEERTVSPEQTRTVGQDLKLHAPRPSLPAQSAKQRVAAVTRTDSDKAASFGIGKPSSEEPAPSKGSIKKKASTSQLSLSERDPLEDEHGIPEIGQRVPMYPNAGDVQAPSPAPPSSTSPEAQHRPRHHGRKHSARHEILPPGSYGLHGHGVLSSDRLDKAYYEKHPEVVQKEHSVHYNDRQHDFAMSSTELNKIVRATANRGSGLGTSPAIQGTPSEEIGFQAHEEYASRMSSPRPASAANNYKLTSPLKDTFKPEISVSKPDSAASDPEALHFEERHRQRSNSGDDEPESQEEGKHAPILASDEVAKDPSPFDLQPAVEPRGERRGSAYEIEDPPSRPASRPSSRPTSIYNGPSFHEFEPTPLEDVKEYEPLFSDEEHKDADQDYVPSKKGKARHTFPSKDVWEDAPNSVHYTAEVSTPDLSGEPQTKSPNSSENRAETPAHAFARHQEELAEREARERREIREYVPRTEKKSTWLPLQGPVEELKKPKSHRFPSRDVWEDAPDSHLQETTVSTPQLEEDKPQVPTRPVKKLTDPTTGEKPAVPERPKPKQTTSDDSLKAKPALSDKPKPQLPARPVKASGSTEQGAEAGAKPKPAVPARPAGGKIAALQAGFMSDLNKRLQLGPQAPKKEEPAPTEDEPEVKEKAPLSDARKGRARGPQRRAPAKSPSPAVELKAQHNVPSLSFSLPQTVWSIGEDSDLVVGGEKIVEPEAETEAKLVASPEPVAETKAEAKTEAVPEAVPEATPEAESKTEPEPVKEETKTLAANMAGETIVEATIEKTGDDEVKPVDVEEVAKD